MSFALTTDRVRQRIKTVTRRVGWAHLKVGDLLCAIKQAQGLKRGERVERLCVLRVTSVTQERLRMLTDHPEYGRAEMVREGFGDHVNLRFPSAFVEWFCSNHKLKLPPRDPGGPLRERMVRPDDEVTRIEFEYVNAEEVVDATGTVRG